MTGGILAYEAYGKRYQFPIRYAFRLELTNVRDTSFRVMLPTFDVDGKRHTFAPIEFKHRTRVEWFAPINC
jgi:hypothetical protein